MRQIIIALLALSMLLPSALAAGNVVTQSNSQTSSGAGVGTITQTGANYGITIGNDNTLNQQNVANAQLTAKVSAVADADLFGLSEASAARQNDGYYIKGGNPSASGSATFLEQSSSVINGVSINQDQNNIAIQLGSMNTMNQKNDASATINAIAYADAYALADAYARANAFAYADCYICDNEDWEYATRASSHANHHVGVSAVADAEVSDVTINQVQENLGTQIGDMNTMRQNNDADATIDIMVDLDARAIAEADAIADISLYAYPTSGGWTHAYVDNVNADASAEAHASASAVVKDISIQQDQKNIGLQLGSMNTMYQSNDADGAIEAEFVYGVSDSDTDFAQTWWYIYVLGGQGAYYANDYVPTSASASAYATASAAETVENLHKVQTQENIAVVVGNSNVVDQQNIAVDPMTGSNNVVTQTSSNMAMIVGEDNVAKQLNDLYADSDGAFYDNMDTIRQVSKNIGVMVGSYGDVDQANDLDAVQADNSEVDIFQDDAENIALTVGL